MRTNCRAFPLPPLETALHAAILCSQTLHQLKSAHAKATVLGLLHHNLSISSALILTYSDFNSPKSAKSLFYQNPLRARGAFLWNSLVRSLTKIRHHGDAFGVYNQMAREGLRPDDRTFPFILTACADSRETWKGREVHASVFKFGFAGDVFVGNTLLGFYGACFFPSDALQWFDEMLDRDVVSWNSLISLLCYNGRFLESVRCFIGLIRTGMKVNAVSVVSTLSACSGLEGTGKGIHGKIIKLGLDSQINVGNVLVDMYAKCKDMESSISVFNSMREKNEVSWNSIIGGLVHGGLVRDALDFFRIMVERETQINTITISSFLPGLAELGFHRLGREAHGQCIRRGWNSDLFVSNSLLDMYAKWGNPVEASSIFNSMESRNVVSWNAMIANFAQNKREMEAISLFKEMQEKREKPNSVTLANLLPACARMAAAKPGKEIHGWSIRAGFCSDIFISNALVDMYAKSGCLDLARTLFNISEKDEVTYNALIVGYSRSLHFLQALDLFVDMSLMGMKYDAISFMGALSACGNLPTVKHGKEVHGLAIRMNFHDHLFVANSLLDLYTKRGDLGAARRVFDRIEGKDVASWNAMILGYGMQGEHEVAIHLFDLMENENVKYDAVSYVAVLSACSHCKLVGRGKKYFNEMVLTHKIQPTEMHYSCMVDLLGRAGFMQEAVDFIKALPFEPGSDVWGALLGAARVHGDLEMGRWVAEHLFKLKPGHSGYYTLLSNMYAEAGRWNEAIQVRERMKSRGVKKNPGCSWVDAGGRTMGFLVGESLEELGGGQNLYHSEFYKT